MKCRICNFSGNTAELFAEIQVARCPHCGTVSMIDLPSTDKLEEYYRRYNDRYTAGMGAHRFAVEMPKRHAAKLRLIGKYAPAGALLDVGCGEGYFLEQAIACNYATNGCDYSIKSKYPTGVKVVLGQLDASHGLPFEDGSFDIVTSWAVIEHVRYPHIAMREINRVLRPGGYAFFDTPLIGDINERLFAARSHWFIPPEHIHVFSKSALAQTAVQNGFEVIQHFRSFERTVARWWARNLRNTAFGLFLGGGMKVLAPAKWQKRRQKCITPIGDIQLMVLRKQHGSSYDAM